MKTMKTTEEEEGFRFI